MFLMGIKFLIIRNMKCSFFCEVKLVFWKIVGINILMMSRLMVIKMSIDVEYFFF